MPERPREESPKDPKRIAERLIAAIDRQLEENISHHEHRMRLPGHFPPAVIRVIVRKYLDDGWSEVRTEGSRDGRQDLILRRMPWKGS